MAARCSIDARRFGRFARDDAAQRGEQTGSVAIVGYRDDAATALLALAALGDWPVRNLCAGHKIKAGIFGEASRKLRCDRERPAIGQMGLE